MGSSGLGVGGVDVTGNGRYTNQAAAASGAVVTTTAASGTNASLAISSASADVFAGGTTHAAAFKALEGTISFGGKSLDLSSVDYGNADLDNNATTTGTDVQHLAVLNKAAQAAFGLATTVNPFSAAGGVLTFAPPVNTAGYTDATGSIDGTAASIAKATLTFAPPAARPRRSPPWTRPSRRCRPRAPTWVPSRTGSTTPSTTSTSRSRT